MTGNGTNKGPAAVDLYLARVPEPARSTLIKLRETIRDAAPPGSTEEIGYGVPAFRTPEPNAQLLAGYVARKKFCSYYPMSGRVIHDLSADLAGYETTSGSIHFPLAAEKGDPLPATLVRKLVKTRLAQIESKSAGTKKTRPSSPKK